MLNVSIAPYGPFATADGSVFLGIQNDREWATFCEDVLQQPDLTGDARFIGNANRLQHRLDLHMVIDGVLGVLSSAEVLSHRTGPG